jgi:hypothetical protein
MSDQRNHWPRRALLPMTVIARSKIGAGRIRRQRAGRRRGRVESSSFSEPTWAPASKAAAKRRREAGAPQDQAVYSCGCGFVFEAHVSTSVGCPHCGGTQAW